MPDLQAQGLDSGGLFVGSPSSIKTFTGRVDPLNPDVDTINIEDIAHALSRQCRYNGHCEGFMSVARHSIWVAERLDDEGYNTEVQLTGLLHDAAEAYLGDLVRPLKHTPFGAMYLEVEAALEAVIAERFSIPCPMPRAVRDADDWVLTELELPDRRFTYYGDYKEDETDFLVAFIRLAGA
jgi:5'-deoxynucleotidase YfbR-like HD superfamily hydrolase